ncbi:hypothetical protein [Cryobacterium arcticum]|uniref:NTP pyrophosphohydrolase n=1 Tax=Cryobacterium arcticum TaxID=670052 RepID=A0A317ZWE5_9MICO|nr:hypothetical protein [Cryobacterium arcticum]PXA71683.1 hypothetical protein CTB96_01775 [Cryobacterium arcticum]
MSSDTTDSTSRGGTLAAGEAEYPGHITVRQKALNTVARAVSAEALGVDPGQVTVTLQDDHGLLGLEVVTPISMPDLDTIAPGYAGSTLLQRVTDAQATIRSTTAQITGNQVGRVDIRVRGAHITEERRVPR